MRKCKKIALVLPVVILYCCIISFYSNGVDVTGSTSSKNQPSQDDSRFSSVPPILYGKMIQTRNVVNVLTNIPVNTLKNHSNNCFPASKASEALHVSHFLRYIFCAANRISGFQSTDIIFPFHYFW
jgi:hypothetical protein